jgi:hypothetical protein
VRAGRGGIAQPVPQDGGVTAVTGFDPLFDHAVSQIVMASRQQVFPRSNVLI